MPSEPRRASSGADFQGHRGANVDDVNLISLAKTEFREGYNNADVERVLSVFADVFTNMSEGDCSFFGEEGKAALREQLQCLFSQYRVQMSPVIIDIVPNGDTAYDWGWHKVVLESRDGSGAQNIKLRYYETWARQADGSWKINFLMTNRECPPRMLGEIPCRAGELPI
jgi:ketosteroid isomerase-like protein